MIKPNIKIIVKYINKTQFRNHSKSNLKINQYPYNHRNCLYQLTNQQINSGSANKLQKIMWSETISIADQEILASISIQKSYKYLNYKDKNPKFKIISTNQIKLLAPNSKKPIQPSIKKYQQNKLTLLQRGGKKVHPQVDCYVFLSNGPSSNPPHWRRLETATLVTPYSRHFSGDASSAMPCP